MTQNLDIDKKIVLEGQENIEYQLMDKFINNGNVNFEEEEEIDEENKRENDAAESLEQKIIESEENIKKLANISKEKEKEKRILKLKIKELQNQLVELELKDNNKTTFEIDTATQIEFNNLKKNKIESELKIDKLEDDFEEIKRNQSRFTSNGVPLLKRFTDFSIENELLEKFIKNEYYDTLHETVHAYKIMAEEIKHDLIQLESIKEDLENEQKKARESTSDLRKQISEVKHKEHKLQEDLEALKTGKSYN